MTRKNDVDTIIADARKQSRGAAAIAGKKINAAMLLKPKKRIGRPSGYTEKIANELCKRISEGETITAICKAMGFSTESVYRWADKYPDFRERYDRARKDQATSLISQLVDEFQANLTNENALAARTKSDLFRWIAARANPGSFGDTKRIELSGEVNHKHTHELSPAQKRRIAESWLISQEDSPGITAQTTGPAQGGPTPSSLESVAVREICEGEQGERPKRKRAVQPTPAIEVDESGKWRGH